jgi:protein-histidine pros-kinase
MSIAVLVCWMQLYRMLQSNAVEEVRQEAGLLMESAISVRSYTIEQIKPRLDPQLQDVFLPQTVPAYAATETFNELRKTYPEYGYKEATLNPTNLRDEAEPWEADIVHAFEAPDSPAELSGVRQTIRGPNLYVARPLKIGKAACLACHDTPADAPPTLIRTYGPDHGFGWRTGQVIGAQVVSVPMSVPIKRANKAFYSFIGLLIGVLVAIALLVNVMLEFLVIRPVLRIAESADQISSGKLDLRQLDDSGQDEIGRLTRSFNRMTISLRKAMTLLRAPPRPPAG